MPAPRQVHGADTDPGRFANAALSAARQSAFLQAGALLKEKINRLKEGEERYRFLCGEHRRSDSTD